jgi:hypothetical protein
MILRTRNDHNFFKVVTLSIRKDTSYVGFATGIALFFQIVCKSLKDVICAQITAVVMFGT